jgi:type IV pilus assembly protein PilM
VVADAFDFIEYPKILSQPEANREELIHEALEQFLSRNSVRGDKVAISVSGQSGLARFFKPPPVEAKKIPDIVKYEARQQIPFALEEVIWDFQQMPGGAEEEGVALDTEVGLFAMKREHVFRALEPFEDASIELDMVQLSPLSIYNFTAYDQLADGPAPEEYDSEDPPESIVILSLGTDTTDLVVTNGFRVWQRSIPLGGNHFTRQLTSELKLTFAKAEHLKRNARQAEDPKAIFKAMRSVFNDLVTEVQRSISYFQSVDRTAKLAKVICVGNATKLPGLQQYLATNLGMDVQHIDKFHRLTGPAVVAAPSFKDNLLAFPVCYGLCLQGLGQARLYTSLLPQEILTNRMIREKKPWAVAAVALLLLAFCGYFALQMRQYRSADVDQDDWKTAMAKLQTVNGQSGRYKKEFQDLVTEAERLDGIGDLVVGTDERRLLWPDLLKAIDACLPRGATANYEVSDEPLTERPELYIKSIQSQRYEDMNADWFADVQDKWEDTALITRGAAPAPAPDDPDAAAGRGPATPGLAAAARGPLAQASPDPEADPDAEDKGPEGPGWVIELNGYHFHNIDKTNRAAQYLRNTVIKNLLFGTVELPEGKQGELKTLTTRDLGISYPVLVETSGIEMIPNPRIKKRTGGAGDEPGRGHGAVRGRDAASGGQPATASGDDPDEAVDTNLPPRVPVCRFKVQFCWQGTTVSQRREMELQRQQAAEAGRVEAAGTPE